MAQHDDLDIHRDQILTVRRDKPKDAPEHEEEQGGHHDGKDSRIGEVPSLLLEPWCASGDGRMISFTEALPPLDR
jgi:hypothetical protein